MLHARHIARFSSALLALSVLAAAGCTTPPKVTAVSPVASYEATVSPPADLLTVPLTGATPPQDAVVPTVPVCAKVHDDGVHATSGVGSADVVYETADSGAGTQLACLFQSESPTRIGPIAPVGMPDLWIVPQYRAMLFSAGSTPSLATSMKRWPGMSDASRGNVGVDAAYSSSYVLGHEAARLADTYSASVTSETAARLRFAESNPATANPIVGLSVPLSPSFEAFWQFDALSGTYLRNVNRKAARDALDHKRISAKNVVVLWTRYTALDPDLAGGGFDVTLGGQGQASVFRDGERFDGKWKADGNTPPRFVAEDGSPIRLAPGNTWFEVIRLSANITLR